MSLTHRHSLRLGAACWIAASLVYFTVEVVAGLAWEGRYNWWRNSISDLGWMTPGWVDYPSGDMWADSPKAWLFNLGSIVAGGLMLLGAWDLRSLWQHGRSPRIGRWITALWVIMGAFTVITAVVPGDVSLFWHSVLAQPIFLAAPVICVLTAYQIRPLHDHLAVTALILGVVALIGTCGLLIQLWVNVPFGLLERMALDGVFVWMLFAGFTGLVHGFAEEAAGSRGTPPPGASSSGSSVGDLS